MVSPNRVNLGKLMLQHGITLFELLRAGAPGPATWALNLGNPVDEKDAQAVITALNALCGTEYTLDDVEALLCSKSQPCHLHKPRKYPALTYQMG